jgi:glycosyltransferase involved in cell wall biosynthesis
MPIAVEFFDLRPYDLVISDTSSFAKGVITTPDCVHICYCHTPTRYLWSNTHEYINELKYNKWLKKVISLILSGIRLWDFAASQRVDWYIANSLMIKKRIAKYYRREAWLIYPPVETDKFSVTAVADFTEPPYFLAGCRLVPYKRIDLVIEAFKKLGSSYRLKIFGDGIDLPRLQKLAMGASNIEFLGRVSEEDKVQLFQGAQAFINPQEEDFGITMVESMAAGRPVIAYQKGGAIETVVAGQTGIFFQEQTAEALAAALTKFNSADFNSDQIRAYADKFSVANFKRQITDFIAQHKKEE